MERAIKWKRELEGKNDQNLIDLESMAIGLQIRSSRGRGHCGGWELPKLPTNTRGGTKIYTAIHFKIVCKQ
jgi:hypothetical protein